jgi:hypothetical protein
MKRILMLLAVLLAAPAALFAQQGTIEHTQPSCVMGGEMPVFTMTTHQDGLLRAYFRRLGTSDWCSVDGQNKGPLSSVTLPKFDTGDEFEYYFVLIDQKRIIAKSPQIYHGKATAFCDTPFTRHATLITMQCLPPEANPVATSMGAGYATKSTYEGKQPMYQSPDRPDPNLPSTPTPAKP